MKKKILSVLLAVCLLVGVLPMGASAAAPGGDCSANGDGSVTWKVENDTLTISGNGDMKNYLPSFATDDEGGEYVPWCNKYTFKKVVIGKGVTSIPASIFLADMTVESFEVEEGNPNYFSYDDCLYEKGGYDGQEYFAIDGMKKGDRLFACPAAKKGSLTIAEGTYVAKGFFSTSCFAYCDNLTEVNFPSTWNADDSGNNHEVGLNPKLFLSSICWFWGWEYAYPNGDSLTAYNISENHPYFKSVDGVIYTKDGKKLCAIPGGKTEITVPDGTEEILGTCFPPAGLTKWTIPASVTKIGTYTYDVEESSDYLKKWMENCKNLTIYGVKGSAAETFAKDNDIPFVATGTTTPATEPTTPPAPGPTEPTPTETPAPTVTTNPDGSKTNTETTEDGTVTATTTWDDGKQAVSVKSPEGETSISLTAPTGEKVAEVNLPAQPAAGKQFEDVKDNGWYKSAVDKATGYGLFNGTTETTFSPNDPMTRGMLATVLHNLSGKPAYGTDEKVFADVTSGQWYEDPVDWAYKAGVVSGTSTTEFSPNDDITREQLVTMLYNYAGKIGAASKGRAALTGFPDASKITDYARTPMQWAVAEGFISGRLEGGKNYIAPKGTATRAEVAAVLTKFVEYLKK